MFKRILVTGATGFTGSFVARELDSAGFEIYCLARESSDISVLKNIPVKIVRGDLGSPEQLKKALVGMDALVNVASIGFGHGPAIVGACLETGVRRALFFSTTAIFTTLDAGSRKTRLAAEEAIMKSGLDYTIFRPTMIYGTPGDRNMIRLIRLVDRFPVVPVFGPGTFLLQPVYVKDLSVAVVLALGNPVTYGRAYNLSGRNPVTYNQVVDTVSDLLGRRAKRVHLPVGLSLAVIRLIAKVPFVPRLTPEQVLRLNEDKAFSHEEAAMDFGYSPVSFSEGMAEEIKEYRFWAGGRVI